MAETEKKKYPPRPAGLYTLQIKKAEVTERDAFSSKHNKTFKMRNINLKLWIVETQDKSKQADLMHGTIFVNIPASIKAGSITDNLFKFATKLGETSGINVPEGGTIDTGVLLEKYFQGQIDIGTAKKPREDGTFTQFNTLVSVVPLYNGYKLPQGYDPNHVWEGAWGQVVNAGEAPQASQASAGVSQQTKQASETFNPPATATEIYDGSDDEDIPF